MIKTKSEFLSKVRKCQESGMTEYDFLETFLILHWPTTLQEKHEINDSIHWSQQNFKIWLKANLPGWDYQIKDNSQTPRIFSLRYLKIGPNI